MSHLLLEIVHGAPYGAPFLWAKEEEELAIHV